MHETYAWYEPFEGSPASVLAKRVEALQKEGVALQPRLADSSASAGIVFFDAISSELLDYLRT